MVNVDDEILSNFNFSFKELQELVFNLLKMEMIIF